MRVTSPSLVRESGGMHDRSGAVQSGRALVPLTDPAQAVLRVQGPAQPRNALNPFMIYVLSRIVGGTDAVSGDFKTKNGIAAYNAALARAAKPGGHLLGPGILV